MDFQHTPGRGGVRMVLHNLNRLSEFLGTLPEELRVGKHDAACWSLVLCQLPTSDPGQSRRAPRRSPPRAGQAPWSPDM